MAEKSRYLEVVETLRDEILSEKYSDASFPSVVQIMHRFAISRATAVRALDELKRRNFIRSRQGRGTFVTRFGRSRKIGILFPETASSEYYSCIIRELSRQAQAFDYALLFAEIDTADVSAQAERAEAIARNFVSNGVSGVVFQPVAHVASCIEVNRRILSVFGRAGIPVVLCDCDYLLDSAARSEYDVVGVNNLVAGAALFRHLHEVGARDIHFTTIAHSARSHLDRLRGLEGECLRLTGHRLPERNVLTAHPRDLIAVRRHLRKGRPDAFVCGNDITAALLIQSLGELGIRVPDDMLVTGFNDVSISRLSTPSITTVHQPTDLIGRTVFNRLVERMANPALPAQEILLSAPLVVRRSTMKRGDH